ncbi:hypothetical protein GGR52DRAFT_568131 [Hypoxylon sp. FL1284]|nr:hypothetical protein GGR52DRAFT_568131 [Hypoxylon sp. FL1284]
MAPNILGGLLSPAACVAVLVLLLVLLALRSGRGHIIGDGRLARPQRTRDMSGKSVCWVCANFMAAAKEQEEYRICRPKFQHKFNMVICNEAHLLKDQDTSLHKSVKCLSRDKVIFCSATPMFSYDSFYGAGADFVEYKFDDDPMLKFLPLTFEENTESLEDLLKRDGHENSYSDSDSDTSGWGLCWIWVDIWVCANPDMLYWAERRIFGVARVVLHPAADHTKQQRIPRVPLNIFLSSVARTSFMRASFATAVAILAKKDISG